MIVNTFVRKYNKTTTAVSVEESHVMPESGVYEAELEHDNVVEDTLNVYSGTSLSGTRLSYTLTAPSDADWKRVIHVETDQPAIYISYETTGDQVEADDVNALQDAVVATQEALNVLSDDVRGGSSAYTWNRLMGISDSSAITIATQPAGVSVVAGNYVQFEIVASSTAGDLTYKWQVETSGSSIWNDLADGDESIYYISSATTEYNGNRYRCIVTDTAGNSEISNVATLHVSS